MNCLNCGKETLNPKFCCKSCSASYTNKTSPKRQKTKECSCGTLIYADQTKCEECSTFNKDISLEQAIYKDHHKSSAFALVRSRARSIMKDHPQVCSCCGYTKHVEVCHIKAISSFPPETMISVINSEANLKLLCPNCHWEFDNGLLQF